MCHAFLSDSRFYQFLFEIDQDMAVEVQSGGCRFCGGVLRTAPATPVNREASAQRWMSAMTTG